MKSFLSLSFERSFAVIIILVAVTGCVSTPRVVQTVPVYTVADATATEPSPYQYSQEPVKRVIEDNGPEYRAHLRALQSQRLEHERNLAAIEQIGKENRLAEERGVDLQALQQQTQAIVQPQATVSTGGAIYPTGYPYPGGSSGSAIYPTGFPYPGASGAAIYPTGYPYAGYGGGCGGYGYGGYPISQGSYRSSVRADWGPVRSGTLQKFQQWLSQGQLTPGYRHTGGPAVITRTYSTGGVVVGGGGFTSGLNFRRW